MKINLHICLSLLALLFLFISDRILIVEAKKALKKTMDAVKKGAGIVPGKAAKAAG